MPVEIGASVYNICEYFGSSFLKSAVYTAALITGIILLIIFLICPVRSMPLFQVFKLLFYVFVSTSSVLFIFKGINVHAKELELKSHDTTTMLGKITGAIPQIETGRAPQIISGGTADEDEADIAAAPPETPKTTDELLDEMLLKVEKNSPP